MIVLFLGIILSNQEMKCICYFVSIICPKQRISTKASLVALIDWNKIFPRDFSLCDSTIDFKFKPPFHLKQNMKIQENQDELFSEYILKDVQDRPVGKIELTKSFAIKNTLNSFFTLIMFVFLIVFILFLTLLFYFLISIFRKLIRFASSYMKLTIWDHWMKLKI